jgi:D-3-phosphoglycerate dehydrogenase
MIFSTVKLHEPARQVLSEYGLAELAADDETLFRCEVLFSLPRKATPELMGKMPNLRAIQTFTAGVDGLDFAVIPERVRIYSNAGGFTGPVAEQTWALILSLAKGSNLRRKKVHPRLLRGMTLLVMGCGFIGSEVARIGRAAFSMKTLGVSTSYASAEHFDERHPPSELSAAIGEADVVVDSLPLNADTKSLLGYGILSRMKPDAIFVNVGRAETVDQEAITRLLNERPDTRFGTDVFWYRDGKEDFEVPLWDLDNFAGTFHSAVWGRDDALAEAELVAAENVRRFLTTGAALNEVDRADYQGI